MTINSISHHTLPFIFKTLILSSLLCFVVQSGAQEQEESTIVYESGYFAQYNAVTLTDMIRNIPGGEVVLRRRGGHGGRGFGASDSQVLINGRRMSGKINNMSTALARIQVAQVERIELIRGNAEGLDIRNEGIIYNVILVDGAEESSSGFLDVGITEIDGMSNEPELLATYNKSRGPLEFGISYQYETRPRLNEVDENILNPDRTLREYRRLFNPQINDNHIFTSTLDYEFQNGAVLQLNGLVSDNERLFDRHEDQFLVGTDGSFTPSSAEEGEFAYISDVFEVGGSLEFDVAEFGRLKTMFVVNRSKNDDEIVQDNVANNVSSRLFTSIADYEQGETIIRSTMTKSFGANTLEYGAEAAFNTLDKSFAFNDDPLENAIVEEDRYEIFVTHSIMLMDKLSLQSALTEEYSKIFQDREGQTNDRSFRFLKPRIELRYDMTAVDQLRLLAERTVSQLYLNNFVASRNVDDDTINFGNPDLEPQSTWSYSLGYERRFSDDAGSIELKASYQDISEHIDKILVGVDDSGTGNIGSAWIKNLEVNLNTRFGFIGLPSAVLTFSYTYEDAETTDPFTGEDRRLRNSAPDYFQVSYRHDVEGTSFAYGFNAHRRSSRLRQDVSLFEETQFEIHLGSAFVEYTFSPTLKMRFAGSHFLNEDGRTFDKTFYDGHIADGNVRRIDFQDWRIAPDYVLSMQATF